MDATKMNHGGHHWSIGARSSLAPAPSCLGSGVPSPRVWCALIGVEGLVHVPPLEGRVWCGGEGLVWVWCGGSASPGGEGLIHVPPLEGRVWCAGESLVWKGGSGVEGRVWYGSGVEGVPPLEGRV